MQVNVKELNCISLILQLKLVLVIFLVLQSFLAVSLNVCNAVDNFQDISDCAATAS